MLEYIYNFLSILFSKIEPSKVRSIILFGSFARGDYRKDSDIDIFIDTLDKDNLNELVNESLKEFELKAEKSWHIKGVRNAIQPIVDNLELDKWSELKNEINLYGKVLFGAPFSADRKERRSALIEYDISKLKQKDKMRIIRKLYGYKTMQRKKMYVHKGIIQDLNGEKVANGILLPAENNKKAMNILKENKIPVKIRYF